MQPARSRQGGEDYNVHVKQRALSIEIDVTAGSDTEVEVAIPLSGGFMSAYGQQGPEKLKNLLQAIARTTEDWFQENPANFSLGRGLPH